MLETSLKQSISLAGLLLESTEFQVNTLLPLSLAKFLFAALSLKVELDSCAFWENWWFMEWNAYFPAGSPELRLSELREALNFTRKGMWKWGLGEKMFKSGRWRGEKNKTKVVFRLQFHATQVPTIYAVCIWSKPHCVCLWVYVCSFR